MLQDGRNDDIVYHMISEVPDAGTTALVDTRRKEIPYIRQE